VSYGGECEGEVEGPTSPRVIEKLRRAKEFYSDVLEEFRVSSVQTLVIPYSSSYTQWGDDLGTGGGGGDEGIKWDQRTYADEISAGQKFVHKCVIHYH